MASEPSRMVKADIKSEEDHRTFLQQGLITGDISQEEYDKYIDAYPQQSVSGTVEGTVSSKGASTSKAATQSASQSSGKGMAGSILHAKGGVADTASGALEGKSKKAKTLG